jgi:hypothetical protein
VDPNYHRAVFSTPEEELGGVSFKKTTAFDDGARHDDGK